MSGIVVDSGAAVTHIVPVIDGMADHHRTRRLQLAGDHVTGRLRHLLAKRGYALPVGPAGGVSGMKERCCYVAVDYAKDLQVRRDSPLHRAARPPAAAVFPEPRRSHVMRDRAPPRVMVSR